MSVRVRYAPSPTGNFHIGGVRTALYNYLYAKSVGGTFVLRIEDTDAERSKREYEDLQINGLKWLGIEHDEGPDKPGNYGPYRQSERLEIYKKVTNDLIDQKKAYYCFCTDEEITRKKEIAAAQKVDPHYDGTCRHISKEDALKRIAKGESAAVRFLVPPKSYTFVDKVKGEVTFPENMVGDFVLLRSSGLPVYNYACVVDDWMMKISHVIRGEDHVGNTLRQLMIYEALGVTPPIFAHVSLIIGSDRQKLSKRHGATSLASYQEQSYLPEAVLNYMCLLGWSHPEEKTIFDLNEAVRVFSLDRFVKSPAMFDNEKFKWTNGQHLRNFSEERLVRELSNVLPKNHKFFEYDYANKTLVVRIFKEKVELIGEMIPMLDRIFDPAIDQTPEMDEINSWESTPKIKDYMRKELSLMIAKGKEFVTIDEVSKWMDDLKQNLKIKGKPLFMGIRGVLTGSAHGADVKELVSLTPINVLRERVG